LPKQFCPNNFAPPFFQRRHLYDCINISACPLHGGTLRVIADVTDPDHSGASEATRANRKLRWLIVHHQVSQ
jgi:hypothetical protein